MADKDQLGLITPHSGIEIITFLLDNLPDHLDAGDLLCNERNSVIALNQPIRQARAAAKRAGSSLEFDFRVPYQVPEEEPLQRLELAAF